MRLTEWMDKELQEEQMSRQAVQILDAVRADLESATNNMRLAVDHARADENLAGQIMRVRRTSEWQMLEKMAMKVRHATSSFERKLDAIADQRREGEEDEREEEGVITSTD